MIADPSIPMHRTTELEGLSSFELDNTRYLLVSSADAIKYTKNTEGSVYKGRPRVDPNALWQPGYLVWVVQNMIRSVWMCTEGRNNGNGTLLQCRPSRRQQVHFLALSICA